MTKLQKVSCVVLSIFFFAVLAVQSGPFFLRGNVYRQFPLYCFLEERARSVPQREDPETAGILTEANREYLAGLMEKENALERKAEETPEAEQEAAPEETPKAEQEAAPEPEQEAAPEETPKAEQEAVPEETPEAEQPASQEQVETAALPKVHSAPVLDLAPETLKDYNYLLRNFFIVDEGTATNAEQLNAKRFLENDLTIEKNPKLPQILIYHSHSQESFLDSRPGKVEDTIVGIGDYLTKLLTDVYGYQVIHVTEEFDLAEGQLDRSKAYDYACIYIEEILKKNPSIEVVIDLHRDGVPEDRHLVTQMNGKQVAQIMFYNGLSYTVSDGQLGYLPNPYIQDNLAFSFQMEYQAAQYYPKFYRGIYLSGFRYNLHLRKRAVLLEAGAQTNTVEEVRNAMEPFADILDRVLTGRGE